MKFCDKLATLRKANNLSQEQLADKLNVSRQSVSKWESGDTYPDMSKMIQMCEILNCTLPELMDDGTFDENYKPNKDKDKNTLSSYLSNFLNYITKTYNMFIHMSGKSKLVCLIEMAGIGLAITLINILVPDLLEIVFDKVFRYVPYGYTISNVLSNIGGIALIVLGVMVFFHLFKIRYLDYYVTITDNTISQQVVEEPIEENATVTALDDKQKKEKVVIRDPEHSMSHFLDGIGKVFGFIFKIFIIFCSIPALVCTIGAIYLAAIMFVNVVYSSVFTYAGICLVGCSIFGLVFVFMAINYLFKRKQPYTVLIILFLSSLVLIGGGAGLATDKALSLNIVDDDYQIKYETKENVFSSEDVKNGYQFEFNCYNIERVIDENVEGVKVVIEMPEGIRMASGEFAANDDGTIKGTFYNFGYTNGMANELYKIKNDIKNGYIRENYGGPHDSVKVKVIMSSEIDKKVTITYW